MISESNSEKEIRIITQIIDIAGKDKKFHEDFQRDSRDVMFGMARYGQWKDEPPDLKCKAERQFQDDTTSLADPSDLPGQVLMEEMKGQIKMDGVHLLELGRGELRMGPRTRPVANKRQPQPPTISDFFSNDQLEACEDFIQRCWVARTDSGSVFGNGYSEPDNCKVKQIRDKALIDMILNTDFSP